MQRYLLLMLFLLSSLSAHAMEEEYQCSFMALQPFLPTRFMSDKALTPFQKVQESKNIFKEKLKLGWSLQDNMVITLGSFSRGAIHNNPTEFLRYCYNLKLHNDPIGFELSDLDRDASLFNKCKEVRIDGYSALGAALIAEDTLYTFNRDRMQAQYKPHFIFELFKKGFRCTEKDKKLVALHLHDVISAEQKQMIISLLHGHQASDLAMLPHDVRRHIVDYIVHLHKKSDWLCSLLNRF